MTKLGHRFGNGRPWADAEVDRLRLEAARGQFNRTRVGELLGRNRNEVAGACHRYDIKFKGRPE